MKLGFKVVPADSLPRFKNRVIGSNPTKRMDFLVSFQAFALCELEQSKILTFQDCLMNTMFHLDILYSNA